MGWRGIHRGAGLGSVGHPKALGWVWGGVRLFRVGFWGL